MATSVLRTASLARSQLSFKACRAFATTALRSAQAADTAAQARKAMEQYHTHEDLHGFDAESVLSETGNTKKDAAMKHFTGQCLFAFL